MNRTNNYCPHESWFPPRKADTGGNLFQKLQISKMIVMFLLPNKWTECLWVQASSIFQVPTETAAVSTNQTLARGINIALPIKFAKLEIESSENNPFNSFGFYLLVQDF